MPVVWTSQSDQLKVGVWILREQEENFLSLSWMIDQQLPAGRRLEQLACRALLKELDPDFPFQSYSLDPHGKPYLTNGYCHFNLSHTSDAVAAVISYDSSVGIDLERINDRVIRVQKKFLNAPELCFIESQDPAHQTSFSTLFWSIKEALYKWWGRGGLDFSRDIQIDPFQGSFPDTLDVRLTVVPQILLKVHCIQLHGHWVTYIHNELPAI